MQTPKIKFNLIRPLKEIEDWKDKRESERKEFYCKDGEEP
jgi:hypothetical protein